MVLIGRFKPLAIRIQVLLRDSGCNSTKVGGEDSAYSTHDCRVLWLQKTD